MVKKIIVPIVAAILAVIIAILGINIYNGRIPYNYKLYSDAQPWIYESYWDETSPETRTVIITDEEAYNEIFKEGDLDVDYNKEMLILHIFMDIYHPSSYKITKVTLDKEQVLRIHYKYKDYFAPPGATKPIQICFLVKMKKMDVTAVEFVEQR